MNVKNTMVDKIICVLITFLIMSFYIFEMATWGRYVFLGVSIVVMLIYSGSNGFKFRCVFNRPFHLYVAIFALFCLMSSTWAWNPSLAISKGITIFLILACFSLIYPYFQQKGSIDILLDAFMFSGYGIALYTVFYFGTNGIALMLTENVRIENEFTNANSIGLLAATSCIIQFAYLLKGEKKIFSVFLIPSVVALAISQSRKAIIMFIVGIVFLIMADRNEKSSVLKKVLKVVFAVTVGVLLIYVFSRVDIFSGVFKRFENLYESMKGTREEDIRSVYRRIGMQQFKRTPVLGIGIGNSLELLEKYGHKRTYLHCNFVELLSSVGILGFILYYLIYVKLLIGFLKYRSYRSSTTNLCIVLLLLMLLMDFGMVTYYDKQQYLYFMAFFLQLDFLKRDKHNEKMREKGIQ